MRTPTRYSIISRIAGAVAGLWLCGAGTAWAGGGADFGSLSALLTSKTGAGICDFFQISTCPTVPSITQAALEAAALGNNLPEMLLQQNQFVPASRVVAKNPPVDPDFEYNIGVLPFPVDNTTHPPLFVTATPATNKNPSGTPASGLLSTLTPLAFISPPQPTSQSPTTPAPSQTAPVTQLSDTNANSFLYAVASGANSSTIGVHLPQPDNVYFFYDDLSRFNVSFTLGTTIAKFTFPLRVLTVSGSAPNFVFTERAVPTTLNVVASSAGDCTNSNVSGDFNGTGDPTGPGPPTMPGTQPPLTAAQVGIDCHVVLSASPASTQQHAIFEVKVPLLVTPTLDPLYFYSYNTPKSPPPLSAVLANPINSQYVTQGVFTAFEVPTSGTGYSVPANTYLGPGISIGLAPSAAPLCSDLPGVVCPPLSPAPLIPTTFPLCANLPAKTTTNSVQLQPSAGAFFALATSGETLLSAALGAASTSTCSLQ